LKASFFSFFQFILQPGGGIKSHISVFFSATRLPVQVDLSLSRHNGITIIKEIACKNKKIGIKKEGEIKERCPLSSWKLTRVTIVQPQFWQVAGVELRSRSYQRLQTRPGKQPGAHSKRHPGRYYSSKHSYISTKDELHSSEAEIHRHL
jgi:hypothetical protein